MALDAIIRLVDLLVNIFSFSLAQLLLLLFVSYTLLHDALSFVWRVAPELHISIRKRLNESIAVYLYHMFQDRMFMT